MKMISLFFSERIDERMRKEKRLVKRLIAVSLTALLLTGSMPIATGNFFADTRLVVAAEDITYTNVSTASEFLSAIAEGKSVKLVNDISTTSAVTINTACTIDFNGKKLTVTEHRQGVQVNAPTTFKNGQLYLDRTSAYYRDNVLHANADTTIDNMTITSTADGGAGILTSYNDVNIVVKDSTLVGTVGTMRGLYLKGGNCTISFYGNVTMQSDANIAYIGAIYFYGNLTTKSKTFLKQDKTTDVYFCGGSVQTEDNVVFSYLSADHVYVENEESEYALFSDEACTVPMTKEEVVSAKAVYSQYTNAVVDSGESLLQAIQNGGNIKLKSDITSANNININKECTIDFNGHTLTMATDKQFTINAASTLKNGTVVPHANIEAAQYSASSIYVLADTIFDNMQITSNTSYGHGVLKCGNGSHVVIKDTTLTTTGKDGRGISTYINNDESNSAESVSFYGNVNIETATTMNGNNCTNTNVYIYGNVNSTVISYCNNSKLYFFGGSIKNTNNQNVISSGYTTVDIVLENDGKEYALFSDEACTVPLTIEDVASAKAIYSAVHDVHTAGEPVRENEVAPTYESEGSYEEVVYCSICGEEISRQTVVVPVRKLIDVTELTLNKGQIYSAVLDIPEGDTYKIRSKNTSVASVNSAGRIVARSEG
ncbi:MAG: hypothetical protein IJU14_02480, partial [Clostridia bacterium]|nr:hypothetical protein [Clostridia bacterium]